MNQSLRVVETIKALLKSQKKTYKELAVAINLTEAGVKKTLNSESLSLSRMEAICSFLGISLLDLMKLSKEDENSKQLLLTSDQEKRLANDERLFVVYYLILTRQNVESICKDFTFDRKELLGHLQILESLDLVTLHKTDQVVAKSEYNPMWLEDGPLMGKYGQTLANEFVLGSQGFLDGYQRFLRGRLDKAGVMVLVNKMKKLEEDFSYLCAPTSKIDECETFALYHGIKPWKFSAIEKYRRLGL